MALYFPDVYLLFGETYHLHLQGRKSSEQEPSVQQMTRFIQTTRRYIPESHILHICINVPSIKFQRNPFIVFFPPICGKV
jgi:hypothetical protein